MGLIMVGRKLRQQQSCDLSGRRPETTYQEMPWLFANLEDFVAVLNKLIFFIEHMHKNISWRGSKIYITSIKILQPVNTKHTFLRCQGN